MVNCARPDLPTTIKVPGTLWNILFFSFVFCLCSSQSLRRHPLLVSSMSEELFLYAFLVLFYFIFSFPIFCKHQCWGFWLFSCVTDCLKRQLVFFGILSGELNGVINWVDVSGELFHILDLDFDSCIMHITEPMAQYCSHVQNPPPPFFFLYHIWTGLNRWS